MPDPSGGPLQAWRDCYVILATGAATFASAMFIVVTIGGRFVAAGRTQSVYFLAATIAHLGFVLFGCALAAAPWPGARPAGLAFVALGLVGLGYALWVAAHVHRSRHIDLLDHLCYGAAPPLFYGLIAFSGWSVAAGREPLGLDLLAASLAALLAVSIRNAWDLLVFFVGRPEGPEPTEDQAA